MVEARVTRGPLPRAWTLATLAAFGLASVGCTMCPDPFDYSGPVPNGSSPQNDFRARSNGILPLGAAPRPWPLIVKDGSGPAAQPQASEPTLASADEAGSDSLHQTVAVVGESDSDEESTVDGQPEAVANAVRSTPPALEPVPVIVKQADTTPVAVEEEAAAKQSKAEKQPQTVTPPLVVPVLPAVPQGETPGWRARRH